MRNHVGGIAGFDLVEDESGVYIENVSFIPTVCHFDSKARNFKIYRFSEYTEELLRSHGTQVRGTDSYRSMDYLRKIIDDAISEEFLVEDFYKINQEVTE
jgi:poly-gamma-glutamate synthesis protein (capsule biosynthesis protein)